MHRRPLRHWRTQDRKTRGLDVPLHIQQFAEVVDRVRIFLLLCRSSVVGTEGELRPSGSYGRNRRDFCRGSQAVGTRSVDPIRTSAVALCCDALHR
jgi:hypothetical protein